MPEDGTVINKHLAWYWNLRLMHGCLIETAVVLGGSVEKVGCYGVVGSERGASVVGPGLRLRRLGAAQGKGGKERKAELVLGGRGNR